MSATQPSNSSDSQTTPPTSFLGFSQPAALRSTESTRLLHSNTTAKAAPQLGTQTHLLGKWQLSQLVSEGTLSAVFDARPLGCPPDRPADYVVKVLKPEYAADTNACDALRREAEVGRHSSHPNLIPILEAHLDTDTPHLVMPKLNGAPLSLVIERVGGILLAQALWITRQVAQALGHLHQQGWVHGDVKPANVMVSRQGHATLIDLAFAMRPNESIYSHQRRLQGTLAYIAPELLTSTQATHPSADIYSLGATLYEMLSGRPPFSDSDPARLIEAHLRQTPPAFDARLRIPDAVEQLVRRMLAKSRLRRPQSTSELTSALMNLEIESLDSRIF